MDDAFVVGGRESMGYLDAVVDGLANGKRAVIQGFAQVCRP